MICSICKKNRATLHIKDVFFVNLNEAKEATIHICKECASSNDIYSKYLELNINDIHSEVEEAIEIKNIKKPNKKKRKTVICKTCGYSLEQLKSTNIMSCDDCYDNFSLYISKLIKRIHGENKHIGRSPSHARALLEREAIKSKLSSQLEELIVKEDYENAAKVRDAIIKLEDNN